MCRSPKCTQLRRSPFTSVDIAYSLNAANLRYCGALETSDRLPVVVVQPTRFCRALYAPRPATAFPILRCSLESCDKQRCDVRSILPRAVRATSTTQRVSDITRGIGQGQVAISA